MALNRYLDLFQAFIGTVKSRIEHVGFFAGFLRIGLSSLFRGSKLAWDDRPPRGIGINRNMGLDGLVPYIRHKALA